jgi:DNA helicase-2/ATP-dependent DNA helicase PcrA
MDHKKTSKIKVFPLNPAQKAAVQAPIAPLLIVAGAGTGKTRTLTSRILHLIEMGVPPERICAITFTNKAAREMANRVAQQGGYNQGPFIGTFHSLGARILRMECRALGRGPNFAIFDDHDSFNLIKKVVKHALPREKGDPDEEDRASRAGGAGSAGGIGGTGRKGAKKNKKETPAFFAQEISKIKNLDGALANSKEPAERKALIATIFEKYEQALLRNNAFDFDDLIEKPVTIFKKNAAILEKYQMKFDAILVDEYQDINPKQYELVKSLAGAHRNISVVGDDEQTIYSWRYADIGTFLGFDKEWPGAQIYFLEENYRSTGNIIRAATAVAENNRWRTPKKLWTSNPDGELISLFEAWGENDEAEWIADEIQKLEPRKRPEIAILYRTNAQSRAIEQALIRHDLPYQIFGGVKFYERREIKDALAALRWASNDRDEVAKERLEKNLSKRKFAVFREKMAAVADAKPIKPTDIIKVFLEIFDYFDYLEENFINADERQENIAELINFASGFENLPDFLEKTSLLQATDDPADERGGGKGESTAGKVNLMTVHLAKGLEFDHVFIAGAAEGLLPHIRSIDNEQQLEEERRLMYVAMTRAKEKLRVSFYGMPSRFLSEIPEDCMELIGAIGNSTDDFDADEKVIEFD